MKLGTAHVNIRANLKPLKAGLALARKTVSAAMRKISSTMKSMARLARRAFIGIVAVVALSVRSFVKFQTELANVSTMLDDQTMRFMPAYSKRLRDMSVAFGESTATLSGGLYDILSASVAADKAISVLTVSVVAAKAGMTTTKIAADAITSVMNSYGFEASEAARISDVLFATVKRGKLTFAELAGNIGKVSALASTANISFEELSAAISTMTRAGLQADIATTSLRGLMVAFLKPTKEAQEMAKKFGFELSSVTLKSIGLVGVLKKLKGATAEQLAVLVPNVRGMAGFAASLKQVEGQASDLKLMLNATGLTQKAYIKMTKTLGFELSRLKQAFNDTGKIIGKVFGDTIRVASESIRGWLKDNQGKIRDWSVAVVNAIWDVYDQFKIWFYMIKGGEAEKAFEQMTDKIINVMKRLWEVLKDTALPIGIEIGEALGKGISKGIEKALAGTKLGRLRAGEFSGAQMFHGLMSLMGVEGANEHLIRTITADNRAARLTRGDGRRNKGDIVR